MNLLVLDTSTDKCALACSVAGEVFENTRSIPRLHNEYLLQMLEELFSSCELKPRDLDVIGFAAGPGSFTGIRISAAVCQALAVAAQATVVPLSSSMLLAHAANRSGIEESALGVQTVLRSRARFAYLGAYDASLKLVSDDVLLDDDVLASTDIPAGWLRVMDAPADQAQAVGASVVEVGVRDLLTLTQQAVDSGADLPPEGAQPRYVQGDTPWVPQ